LLGIVILKAVLKIIVDFYTLLIGAEGGKTPVGVRFRGDPAGVSAEEARRNAHEPLASGAEINRQL
jgi:hypothetical protein